MPLIRNLEKFGKKLRHLRTKYPHRLSQAKLADKIGINRQMISIWERTYQNDGRFWIPPREYVVKLITVFVNQLNAVEAQQWADLVGYQLSKVELKEIFLEPVDYATTNLSSIFNSKTNVQNVKPMPNSPLFGVDTFKKQLQIHLSKKNAPWVIAIDGIGGIGKTALAKAIVCHFRETKHFDKIAWVSAKPIPFDPAYETESIRRLVEYSSLNKEGLIDSLLKQVGYSAFFSKSVQEKWLILMSLLKEKPYLVVIDSLESVADYQNLVPIIHQLANPSKIVLTTRHSFKAYTDIFCLRLHELEAPDAFALLQSEAKIRGITALAQASNTRLEQIYQVVGGNPLALKFVVGQIGFLPLSEILTNLKEAQGKQVKQLYTYIYWQSCYKLDSKSYSLFLTMPSIQCKSPRQISTISNLTKSEVNQALAQLIAFSLVEVYGDIDKRQYGIDRLTKSFLLEQAIMWQQLLKN